MSPGQGNSNAPGLQKKEVAPTATAAASTSGSSGHGNASAPGQEKKTASAMSTSSSNGQSKQAAKAAVSTPGVKPSNTTSHWTHCTTGGTTASTTCSGNGPKADGSKQYGNGKTAAQIAVSRGGVGVVLTGPGNSQPHKVAICPKKSNKSGGVDVHAVKSYSTAACATQASVATGILFAPTPTAVQSLTVTSATQPTSATQAPLTRTPAGGTTGGGVLGVQTTVAKSPKSGAAGGVLGAATKLGKVAAKGTLPFTGLPLWLATFAGLALIGTGIVLRAGRPAEA